MPENRQVGKEVRSDSSMSGLCEQKGSTLTEVTICTRLASKTDRMEERRPRLPPGQRRVGIFPVLDIGIQPHVPTVEWNLSISGQVEVPTVWDWAMFLAQPQVTIMSDIHCVTRWSRFDNKWQGVAASHLLSVVRPRASARFVIFLSFDGYVTNVPLTTFAAADVLLAHSWQDKPLNRMHGWPVRVVIPGLYFWKSAKWIQKIVLLDVDTPGYWETRGYHNNGDPWQEERYNSS